MSLHETRRSAVSQPVLVVLFAAVAYLNLNTAGTAEEIARDVRAQIIQSTVRILAVKVDGAQAVGAGIVVEQSVTASQVFVLTAWHVVADAHTIRLETFALHDDYPSPSTSLTAVSVCSVNESADIALLCVRTKEEMPGVARLAPVTWMAGRSSKALSCGCSLGEPPTTWTMTIASDVSLNHRGRQAKFWRTNEREPFQGESGGALVDERGLVIGICSMGKGNEGLYSHISEIHAFLKQTCLHSLLGEPMP